MYILPIQKTSQKLSDILQPLPKIYIFYTNLSTLFTPNTIPIKSLHNKQTLPFPQKLSQRLCSRPRVSLGLFPSQCSSSSSRRKPYFRHLPLQRHLVPGQRGAANQGALPGLSLFPRVRGAQCLHVFCDWLPVGGLPQEVSWLYTHLRGQGLLSDWLGVR